MRLEEYHYEMSHCHRCSYCKFMPFQLMQSRRFAYNCPSIALRNFHSYSAGGRVVLGLSLLEGRLKEYTDTMRDVVFECTLCGACQSQCRTYNYNLNPIEVMQALRCHFVEQGEFVPEQMMIIENLKREDNVFGEPKQNREDWADGLVVKDANREKVDVLLHVGCRASYDQDYWPVARAAVALLKMAGVDVGIAGKAESCCGGRAYEMGFKGVFENLADDLVSRVKTSGAKALVTLCGDGYGALKQYYPLTGRSLDVEVLHITECIWRLIEEKRLQMKKDLPLTVTYHDPCHLGRRGEPGIPWQGEYTRLEPHIFAPVPEKPMYLGLNGCYEPPRNILKAIPGVQLVEMERNRIFSWCCGAGAGVWEAYEELASFSASERIEEARSTGAEALVTACPWCERNFRDTVEVQGTEYEIFDVVDLAYKSMGGDPRVTANT
ncbi:MAG: (Fe-S)-binding protein [Deltaproteobacteria bacterium]|nr:(Fe-S)-binding protein [Deltaproteobacteria bacterium]